jgi:hypothetical protein
MPDHVVSIGEVIVNGIIFDPKNSEALRTMDLEALLKAVPRLFDLLDERGVEYVLVGGIAMLVYVEGRNTQDIDLVITAEALDELPELTCEDRNPDFVRARFGELPVDLLLTTNKLFNKVYNEHSVVKRFVEREIRCATVEGLILLKLFALPSLYRQHRLDRVRIYENDVTDLIANFQPDLGPIFQELSNHVLDTDLTEIRNIVRDIEDRIARSRQRFGNGDSAL